MNIMATAPVKAETRPPATARYSPGLTLGPTMRTTPANPSTRERTTPQGSGCLRLRHPAQRISPMKSGVMLLSVWAMPMSMPEMATAPKTMHEAPMTERQACSLGCRV